MSESIQYIILLYSEIAAQSVQRTQRRIYCCDINKLKRVKIDRHNNNTTHPETHMVEMVQSEPLNNLKF